MYKIVIVFLFSTLAFSQSVSLEDKIYNAVDVFVTNPNESSLIKLNSFENTISAIIFNSKNKKELLAFVILKCNKAFYENQFGQTQNAIKSYENAWQIFDKNKLSNYDITESCLKPLGNLYTIIGDYTNAENTIKQYFYIANTDKNNSQKYASILNLSIVYQNTGRNREAIDLIEKTIKTETLSNAQKGMLWNNLGNNYSLLQDTKKASQAWSISIQLFNQSGQKINAANAYRNTALLNNNLNDFTKAKELFFQNKNNSKRDIAKLYNDEAIIYFQNDSIIQSKKALENVFKTLLPTYKNGLPKINSLYAETNLLDALDTQAHIYMKQNQPKNALKSYALSFHIEELLQSLLVYENSKIITKIRNRNRTEKCIAIYADLYNKEKKINYLESAFLLADKTKSTVLKDEVANKNVISREEKLIREQLQNWNTIIIKEQQKLDYADISKINEAIKKQNELMLMLKSKDSKESKKTIELKMVDLFAKLEKDKANLIEYFYGEYNCYVFKLENAKIKLETIKNVALVKPKIIQFLDFFKDSEAITNNPNDFNSTANVSCQLLKIPQKSETKNLIIIPDGILNLLPFEALITKKSATTIYSKMHYLLNDYVVSYSNSADFYLNPKDLKKSSQTVLGIFPVFENSPLELTFSKKEMEAIQKTFDGKYLSKKEATFDNFKSNAINYSILHLSTHASSGDLFEPASIKFYDQDVLYSELYNLNFNPNLVVLSACETGIGKFYKSEGTMSVARGFQFAGAQNLLFSLWKVNDYTTSVFMANFYSKIKKGNSFSQANHDAKLNFLNDSSITNAKKSPYYWSAFVYYGSLEEKVTTNYWLYFLIIVGVIGLFLFFRKKL